MTLKDKKAVTVNRDSKVNLVKLRRHAGQTHVVVVVSANMVNVFAIQVSVANNVRTSRPVLDNAQNMESVGSDSAFVMKVLKVQRVPTQNNALVQMTNRAVAMVPAMLEYVCVMTHTKDSIAVYARPILKHA